MSFGTKTPKRYKRTNDVLFFYPNHMHIIFGHFIDVFYQYCELMLRTKEEDPKYENLPKIETNPRWLHFSPKSFAHNFWSFWCCFPSIRL